MRRSSSGTVLSALVGELLRSARRESNITREQLARRARVSARLVAELERGQRPNVSLESALKLLNFAGTTILLKSPGGLTAEVGDKGSADLQRAARAEVRRKSWTGGQISLHEAGAAPNGGKSPGRRMAAVSTISLAGFAIAGSRKSGR